MNFLEPLLRRVPHLEIIIRIIYWRINFIHKLVAWARKTLNFAKIRKNQTRHKVADATLGDVQDILDALKDHGLRPGDILILHSSFRQIRKFEADPKEVINAIMEYLGPQGTLVIPSIPVYENAVKGTDRITKDISDDLFTYDVENTPTWTGVLAQTLVDHPDSVRSSFPLNSLVAVGFDKDNMFKSELKTELETPNGPQSAWAYCGKKNALIVAFGTDLTHSLTMIHTAEDSHADTWPIPDWYRRRRFEIVNGDNKRLVQIRERHPKWAMHYAERKLSHDLDVLGHSHIISVKGVPVVSIRSQELLDFLISKQETGYPYYLWKFSG